MNINKKEDKNEKKIDTKADSFHQENNLKKQDIRIEEKKIVETQDLLQEMESLQVKYEMLVEEKSKIYIFLFLLLTLGLALLVTFIAFLLFFKFGKTDIKMLLETATITNNHLPIIIDNITLLESQIKDLNTTLNSQISYTENSKQSNDIVEVKVPIVLLSFLVVQLIKWWFEF